MCGHARGWPSHAWRRCTCGNALRDADSGIGRRKLAGGTQARVWHVRVEAGSKRREDGGADGSATRDGARRGGRCRSGGWAGASATVLRLHTAGSGGSWARAHTRDISGARRRRAPRIVCTRAAAPHPRIIRAILIAKSASSCRPLTPGERRGVHGKAVAL